MKSDWEESFPGHLRKKGRSLRKVLASGSNQLKDAVFDQLPDDGRCMRRWTADRAAVWQGKRGTNLNNVVGNKVRTILVKNSKRIQHRIEFSIEYVYVYIYSEFENYPALYAQTNYLGMHKLCKSHSVNLHVVFKNQGTTHD